MSVYIRGFEMPQNCWECNLIDRDYGFCLADGKNHDDYDNPIDCPDLCDGHYDCHDDCLMDWLKQEVSE